jgi:HEAT repeat protein
MMLDLLRISRNAQVGVRLRSWAAVKVPMQRRARSRRQALAPRQPSVAGDFPYRGVLRALRGHGSPETESFLLLAARDWDPVYRQAAVSSLGWWEPYRRPELLHTLGLARRDPNPDVRQTARAALARLGERSALQGFRTALTGEDNHRIHEIIQLAAQEGLTLLWPDLDRLTEADDFDIAQHARDALECLSEDMENRR